VQITDLPAPEQALTPEQEKQIVGGRWKRNGLPWYTAPKVYYDDGINVHTSDPSTSNVGYDSPLTPIQ
jgi:hypothetical protein